MPYDLNDPQDRKEYEKELAEDIERLHSQNPEEDIEISDETEV